MLVLLNKDYNARFWTNFEAFLATQKSSSDGLAPSNGRRCTVTLVDGGSKGGEEVFRKRWLDTTLEEATSALMQVGLYNFVQGQAQAQALECPRKGSNQ